MDATMDWTESFASAGRVKFAFSRLQVIKDYISVTKDLITQQERHVRALGVIGADTDQDRGCLIMMRQSLELMERYKREILANIEAAHH